MPEFKSKEENEEYECVRCGATVKEDDKFCPKCGDTLEEENIPSPKEPPSQQKKDDKKLRQLEKLQQFKYSNRKINCPSCRNSMSINAVACPSCGQSINNITRINEFVRINRNQIIIAAIILGVILIGLIGTILSPKKTVSDSSQPSTGSSSTESSSSSSEAERTIKLFPKRPESDSSQPSVNVSSLDLGDYKFIVGEKYLGDEMLRVIDRHFPTATFLPNESIIFTFNGNKYTMQTKKVNYTGAAYYEIILISVPQPVPPAANSKESSESTSSHKWIDKEGNIHFSGTVGEKVYKGSDSFRERLYTNEDDEKKCTNFNDFKKYKDDPAYQKLLCERYHIIEKKQPQQDSPKSNSDKKYSSSPASGLGSYHESESARKEVEKDEIRRKRDALQPALRQYCLQGSEEACRQYREWENLRNY